MVLWHRHWLSEAGQPVAHLSWLEAQKCFTVAFERELGLFVRWNESSVEPEHSKLSVCGDAAVGGPVSEFFDLFVHENRQGSGLGELVEEMSVLDFGAFLERGVHRANDSLFQLGTVKPDAGGGELFQVEDAG